MLEKKDVAEALAAARRKSGLKLKDVAEQMGNSAKTISAWECAHSQPDAIALLKMCQIYGFGNINEMLGCTSEKTLSESLRVEERSLVEAFRKLDEGCKSIVIANIHQIINYLRTPNAEPFDSSILTNKNS